MTKRNLVSQQSDGALLADHLSAWLGQISSTKTDPDPKTNFSLIPGAPELRLSIEVSSQNTCKQKQNVQTKTEDKSNSETSGEIVLQVSVRCTIHLTVGMSINIYNAMI